MKLLERPHNSFDLILYPAIAAKLEACPHLLATANEVLEGWEQKGITHPNLHKSWRELIQKAQDSEKGFQFLLELLRCDEEWTMELKSTSPLCRILDLEERRKLIRQCE